MKVLHFTRRFSPTSETFVYDFITELEKQEADNHVATLQRFNESSRSFPKVTEVDIPSRWSPRRLWHFGRHLVAKDYGTGRARGTSAWPQIRDRLEGLVTRVQPNIIHAHFGPAGVLISAVAETSKIPLVTTFYGYDISSLPEVEFWQKQYAALWSRSDVITVLSEEMQETALRLGCPDDKLTIVRLSRNLKHFSFRPPSSPVSSVVFVGRLVPKKAPLDAVQAVQRVNEQGTDLVLDMVGDGPLQDRVHRYIRENNLLEKITLHGRLPNADVADRMRSADAFLLPSKTGPDGDCEGTPTVLVEAQATGLPCIATHHAGIPEMIPEAQHNLLVPEGDVSLLADALRTVASYPVHRLRKIAKRGREKVENEFSLSNEAENLRKIYRSCV